MLSKKRFFFFDILNGFLIKEYQIRNLDGGSILAKNIYKIFHLI